ncbi:MAG: hypothetical protein Q4B08_03175 [Propionibacteriaceae bacterium]|nr:hypothetical protein [Propionibacteriaceae bacterium]
MSEGFGAGGGHDAQWRLQNFLHALDELPPVQALSFRGSVPAGRNEGDYLQTRGITATSTEIEVATAGFAAAELAVIAGFSARDVSPLSAVPQAMELTFPPGVLFLVGPEFELEGLTVRVLEERGLDAEQKLAGPSISLTSLKRELTDWIATARRKILTIDPEYSRRFTDPMF